MAPGAGAWAMGVRRWCALAAAFALIVLAGARADAPARGESRRAGTIGLLLQESNAARHRHGLRALESDPELSRVAQSHADDMAARGYFAHESPEGESAAGRVTRIVPSLIAFDVTENLSRTTSSEEESPERTAAEAVNGWLKSPGHRRNLLHAPSTHVGFGVAEVRTGGQWRVCVVQVCAVVAGEWRERPALRAKSSGTWRAHLAIPLEFMLASLDEPARQFPDPSVKGLSWVGAMPLPSTPAKGEVRVAHPAVDPGRYDLMVRRMGAKEWWRLASLSAALP